MISKRVLILISGLGILHKVPVIVVEPDLYYIIFIWIVSGLIPL
jgi:hypothetical protein